MVLYLYGCMLAHCRCYRTSKTIEMLTTLFMNLMAVSCVEKGNIGSQDMHSSYLLISVLIIKTAI